METTERAASFQFAVRDLHGIGLDQSVHRADASAVLLIAGTYHLWYTRTFDGGSPDAQRYWLDEGRRELWLATSQDGVQWNEERSVMPVAAGVSCNRGRHAPDVLAHGGMYYLYFTAHAGDDLSERCIWAAAAHSAEGPYELVHNEPILAPVADQGQFDSWVLDDPCAVREGSRIRLYYKGRSRSMTPAETWVGLATAERPEGPFTREAGTPFYEAHTSCVWRADGRWYAFADNPPEGLRFVDGGEGEMRGKLPRRLLSSEDGRTFSPVSDIEGVHVEDAGVAVAEATKNRFWGITLQKDSLGRSFLARFDAQRQDA